MDIIQEPPTLLSLCTGYGGLDIGIDFVLNGTAVLAFVEIEAFAVANLVAKMEAGQMAPVPVWTDIKTLPLAPFRNRVDILAAGYPCQPFSTAGRREGKEDPRHLWPHIARTIDNVRPGIVFLENVEGHITLGLRDVLADLAGLGYRVDNSRGEPTWGLFSASEVGATHQRKRVFILAIRNGYGLGRILRKAGSWKNWAEFRAHTDRKGIGSSRNGASCQMADTELRRWRERGEPRRRDPRTKVDGCDQLGRKVGNTEGGEQQRLPHPAHRQRIAAGRPGAWNLWPAPPGHPQHEWEQPRVVADDQGDGRREGEPEPKGQQGRSDADQCRESVGNTPQRKSDGRDPASLEKAKREGGRSNHAPDVASKSLANPEDTDRRAGTKEQQGSQRIGRGGSADDMSRQAKCQLGGTAHGDSNRVDPTANRVDRLRLCGNGVVWLTAAKAFLTLLMRSQIK